MTEQNQYKTTREWENARPFNAVFQEFKYAGTKQVIQVIGHVDLIIPGRGKFHTQIVHVPVKWNYQGRAFAIKNNQRMSDNDIIFD